MQSELIIGLLHPIMSLVFFLTFIIFWSYQRKHSFILGIAAAFLLSAIGRILATFIFGEVTPAGLLVRPFVDVAAVTLLISAISNRVNLRAPINLMLGIGTVGVVISFYQLVQNPTINGFLFCANITVGSLFLVGFWHLRNAMRVNRLDRFQLFMIFMVAFQLIVTTSIALYIDGPILPDQLSSSTYKLVTGLSTVISIIIFALSLLASCVADQVKVVRRMSLFDQLTGLKNRAAFELEANQLLSLKLKTNSPFSLLVIDVDNFSAINDEFGLPVGDRVLRAFGGILCNAVKHGDISGRVGGEEFCVLLTETDYDAAQDIAESLRACLGSLAIPGLPKGRYVTVSIGIATRQHEEGYESLFQRANKALRHAKRKGSNTVRHDNHPQLKSATRAEKARQRIRVTQTPSLA